MVWRSFHFFSDLLLKPANTLFITCLAGLGGAYPAEVLAGKSNYYRTTFLFFSISGEDF